MGVIIKILLYGMVGFTLGMLLLVFCNRLTYFYKDRLSDTSNDDEVHEENHFYYTDEYVKKMQKELKERQEKEEAKHKIKF